ncbi:hypothetical protein ZIOFF_042134 [Zingiber officinale]|uniref:Rab-GAP TBC domain-containing protein n=1 Tax=Zingiber officinale TaxID=94328 RepID=A0A8J5G7L4_ZINOF|nr:hypothetical protein ZIOFF_042134 [Zingiber officinale]
MYKSFLSPGQWRRAFATPPKRSYWITTVADPNPRPTAAASIPEATFPVKFEDLYGFTVEGNIDDVNVLTAERALKVRHLCRDSDVGYCQGLNYVAALLLLVLKTEEDAFWMLTVLLENVLVSDCYTVNLSGCHVEQRVFRDLLVKKCPSLYLLLFTSYPIVAYLSATKFTISSCCLNYRIAAHLEAVGFDVTIVATEWFLCLFAKSLPSEVKEIPRKHSNSLFRHGTEKSFDVSDKRVTEKNCLKPFDVIADERRRNIECSTNGRGYSYSTKNHPSHVTFDKIGSMTSNSITKERKKQEPAVMAELNQRLQRLNSLETNSYHPWAAHVHECRCGWSMPTTSKMVQGFIPMCKDQRNRNVNRLSLVSKNCKKKNIPL